MVSRTFTYQVTASGDGDLTKSGSGFNAWNSAHSATSGTADDTGTSMRAFASFVFGFPSSRASIERCFIPFDLSTLQKGIKIKSAKIRLYVSSKTGNSSDTNAFFNIVGLTSAASTTSLTANDYDNCGAVTNPTEYATRITYGSITASAYNDFILNSAGLLELENQMGVGVVKFGVRVGNDTLNKIPSSGTTNQITIFTGNSSGNKPQLVIEDYSLPQVI